MPIISVYKDILFQFLGQTFSDKGFRDLCFEYGIELDEITTAEELVQRTEKKSKDEIVYKIEVPANRYDLLCVEGLSRALKVFLGQTTTPIFKVLYPTPPFSFTVESSTALVRPYVVSAVLRDINWGDDGYNSFLDLQERLHFTVSRQRKLVAIGTHDLDKIQAPFVYKALPPNQINFIALNEEKSMNAQELFNYYDIKENCKIKQYLPLVRSSDVYPVIYDNRGQVLSLPPIINSEYSKMDINTKNVFIECTAIDHTRATIVLQTMVSMFCQLCAEPFTVEAVEVIYQDHSKSPYPDQAKIYYPDMGTKQFKTTSQYINQGLGLHKTLSPSSICELLGRMQLSSKIEENNPDNIIVNVPVTRSDILHPCDIMEDVGIAFGYNNIIPTIPKCSTIGKQQLINKFSDLNRELLAQSGYLEILTWCLCSYDENYQMLLRPDLSHCVKISNPKTAEFQVARTQLISSLLKTISCNQGQVSLPIRLFEVSDIILQNKETDTGAQNRRHCAFVYCGKSSGFDLIHGTVDYLLQHNNISYNQNLSNLEKLSSISYCYEKSSDPTFLPTNQASILIRTPKMAKPLTIGVMGIVHPEVLKNFSLNFPCSLAEIDLQILCEIIYN